MARPRTRDHRRGLHAVIDEELFDEFQQTWHASGLLRWQVLEEVLRLGLAEYQARGADEPPELDYTVRKAV